MSGCSLLQIVGNIGDAFRGIVDCRKGYQMVYRCYKGGIVTTGGLQTH
jgi:hypothetical protein